MPIIDDLNRELRLNEVERTILEAAGVRSPEEVHSLLSTFPSLALNYGVRTNQITAAIQSNISAVYNSFISSSATSPPPEPELGAVSPPGVIHGINSVAGIPPRPSLPITAPTVIPAAGPIDLRLSLRGPWPVRDQGRRGTCVAFGAAACVEHRLSATGSGNPDFSEQFLYYGIKTNSSDPNHNTDGTWLQFARDILQGYGICDDPLHPYEPGPVTPVRGTTTPSSGAINDASTKKLPASTYQRKPGTAAATLLGLLQNGRPVAASFPVFVDPTNPAGQTNWTGPISRLYGRIFDPPIHTLAKGGHCVCITGFVPDTTEPTGGYFILRNSWGPSWASQASSPGYNSPEQGYGEISASYVDTYCWELLQI
jgi:hypothetical protein